MSTDVVALSIFLPLSGAEYFSHFLTRMFQGVRIFGTPACPSEGDPRVYTGSFQYMCLLGIPGEVRCSFPGLLVLRLGLLSGSLELLEIHLSDVQGNVLSLPPWVYGWLLTILKFPVCF